jgi:UPF0271 protein
MGENELSNTLDVLEGECAEAKPARKRSVVLDTSAFIAGFDPSAISDAAYTVPSVERELTSNSIIYTRFKTAAGSGKLRVKTPNNVYFSQVEASSTVVGDIRLLSEVDIEVLALALELKALDENPLIVTDDYSIQNVANNLGLGFVPLMTFGIRYRLDWTIYCPGCHRKYPADYKSKTCKTCGTELKRKPLKRIQLQK